MTIAAPAAVTPHVQVTGPSGYAKTLSATTTLSGLAAGSYTIASSAVSGTDSIVDTVFTGAVTGSPATVAANATATATVTYAARPGTGGLWVGTFSGTLLQYSAHQLRASTSALPATLIDATNVFSIAIDTAGGVWMTQVDSGAVLGYAANQVATTGSPTPAVTLRNNAGSLNSPTGLAFDATGNLWVGNVFGAAGSIVEFSGAQLTASGSPTPIVTIGQEAALFGIFGLAFDPGGNLWAITGNNTAVEFTPSQLAASGTPAPNITISDSLGSTKGGVALAFDAHGNLWIANSNMGANTISEILASQLTSSGARVAAVVLSATAGSLDQPVALAFDNSGNLWVTNRSNASIVEFTSAQITTTGSPTPAVTITGSSLQQPLGLAFDPHPANLPIKP